MTTRLIAPSILSADFSRLGEDIEMINQSDADYIHCDVMDGVFVPNISFGIPVIEKVAEIAKKPLDVHLMIVNPDNYISAFQKAGADILTVHYETCPHLHRIVSSIKEAGMKASVCLNPHTPVTVLDDIIGDLDMVLLMSVNPGFGGQSFIKNTYKKVRLLKEMIAAKNQSCLIEVDGGVNFETGLNLYDAGADVLVSGSFIFKADDPIATINHFKTL
ncbi:ribulose-phosphate 3-epimerase [Sunxiuqinia elliptica]|uniref:Ribulose-phosphate 3-epimerase n=1 Tax=Sunxiuqinia elliptica TaxID=655355 RepID=A0A4R6GPX4_9BACT|nr:ribulose-phosphate 3-epimerase [Sunxiuqinia elliptica]TDN97117.1 ribulose-phosphate 3-epimerase [Sunxiuqinia elliptica]TDO60698.1 ribulose-phosphate 3-epimerase [Sunxiuqinia elliptica]